MVLAKTNADYAYEGWVKFWQDFADFFWKADDRGLNYLSRIAIAIAIIVVAWLFIKLVALILRKALKVKKGPEIDASMKYFVIELIKTLFWIGIAFLVASVLKFDLTGIAGITSAITVALGLALQDLLGSFFSGILILNQKIIKTGDYIMVKNAFGECEGTVLRIHFFVTFLNTPKGQRVIIPNRNISASVITNFTTLGRRRIDYDVGVAYDTDIAKAKEALYSTIADEPLLLPNGCKEVYVESLGPYYVNLRLRCWVKVENYWKLYNQLSERVLLAFREAGVVIPSSTDYTVKKIAE